jgi:acyl-coenzyme A thioesterase PaaI-like protein
MHVESFTNQAEMERALQIESARLVDEFAGTVNAWFAPQFVSCDFEKDEFVCAVDLKKEYANPSGVTLHGGITDYIFDTAMGMFSSVSSGCMTPTISITVNYERPIPISKRLFVRVHMDKPGRVVNYLSAVAFNEDAPDKVLSTATATYLASGV